VSTLAETFEEGIGHSLDEEARARLDAAIAAMLETAHEAWPGLKVEDERFVAYVAERVAAEEDPLDAVSKRCIDDLYLACACAEDDPKAIGAFDGACLATLAGAVRRINPSPEFLDEVKQHTRVNLLVADGEKPKRITTYRGMGRLKSWVRVGAIRSALELRRKSRPQDARDDDILLDASDLDDDPELMHIKQLYRKEFAEAFQRALATLESRDRNVLRMYLVDGLNIDQIGTVYRVHRATVARWIGRSREKLLAETRRELTTALSISKAQFESLMVVIQSHLDLSMERLLRE